ncbi:hypothetical protein COT44_04985 [Candidatus Shapirobacteria bacterium CG08_land_8_20_14_0_20_39_18]|uniref:Uncharacterized protein n=1 Tax=Candidatus Shapirobacteria bacterium CG08_land_8_20_14_0_20_39_18 TaxID=1974883 RepID=A0A2M6XBP8_9BACT|nr:MAG: hypothetical protein COT44_04985 [Candidatus Shapirobacteria bacterium CG08_land_8_20_14_0_20_39_18]
MVTWPSLKFQSTPMVFPTSLCFKLAVGARMAVRRRVRGCPQLLVDFQKDWVDGVIQAISEGEYRPLSGGNGDLASFVFSYPEKLEGCEIRPDFQAYHPRWVQADGDLKEFGEKVMVISLAGAQGLQKAKLLARVKQVELFACGTWGNNGNSPVSYRDLRDPAVCQKLAVSQPDFLPTIGGATYRVLLNSRRPADQPVKIFHWPGTFVSCHCGWRNLADDVIVCQWQNNPAIAKVGIDTALGEPSQNGDKIFVPWGWGFVCIGARDLRSLSVNYSG